MKIRDAVVIVAMLATGCFLVTRGWNIGAGLVIGLTVGAGLYLVWVCDES